MTGKQKIPPNSLTVGPDGVGQRLDVFLAARLENRSRSQVKKLNGRGAVTVDGSVRPDHYLLKDGEVVKVSLPAVTEEVGEPVAQKIALKIAYEDDHLVVINKSAGIVAHPAHGNWDGTVVNALLGRGTPLSELGGEQRPGVVHRLDKDTSGLMVLAKTDVAYSGLAAQIRAREVKKVYHSVVWGNLGMPQRTIDAPISRHPVHRQKMTVARRGGREAITEVFVVDSFEYFDYIRVVTLTGRTHQIRVHLSHISHPIVGDPVYGGRRKRGLPSSARIRGRISALLKLMPRHALHASRLSFVHPVTGEQLDLRTALPEDMRIVLEMLHVTDWIKEARR